MTATPTAVPYDSGCTYTITQILGTARTYVMAVECDPTATTMQPPAAFTVTAGARGSYTFTGTFKYAGVC